MNEKEVKEIMKEYRERGMKQQSLEERIKQDGRGYAKLNNKLGIKSPNGPSKDARPMTQKEKEALRRSKNNNITEDKLR
ncbi:hypothetical protein [Staphylococcus simulans]|uniref:hypothetical protein n=1 Tax=Staphylococcus simulans TaxID=1286 RepID=UPI000D04362C|nr:hypothetical protein [Staphylococcus simulans]